MKTYQDWLKVADKSETERMAFIRSLINEHKSSDEYKIAEAAEAYYAGLNPTIMRYQKMIYNALGKAVPDYVSANHKIASKIFYRIVVQEALTLLGNGISWNDNTTSDKLGRSFDRQVYKLARAAIVQRAAYGFWNLDHIDVFEFMEFAPLLDEDDGSIKAGVRFWQLDTNKPLNATMYEIDGYTDYIWREGVGQIKNEKRAYIISVAENAVDGRQIYDMQNYPTFPVVPLYANELKISELVGIKEKIDAYDLITSGYVNDTDDMNVLYWTVTNAGGMDDADLVTLLDKLRKIHIADVDSDQSIEAHTVDMPYMSREAILDRLEKQIYRDAMALNTYDLASGAVTATEIQAAYEPLNEKLDLFEMQVSEFVEHILDLAGIDDRPSYTRSIMVNKSEEVQTIVNAALYLDDEYVAEKVMTLLGDADKVEELLEKRAAADYQRLSNGENT